MNPVFAQALQHHQSGQIDQALALYRRLAADGELAGDNLLPLYGMAALDQGQWDEAEAAFSHAMRTGKRLAECHVGMGGVHLGRRNRDAAIESYGAALRIDPANQDALKNLGALLFLADRYDESIPVLKAYLLQNPRDVDALISLGAARRLRGDLAGAMKTLQQAGEIAPENSRLHYELGNVALVARQYAQAEGWYARAAAAEPKNPDYRSHLALALEEQGRVEDALACHQAAVEANPSKSGPHNNMGRYLRKLGRLEEAEAHIRRAVAISPRPVELYSNLAVVLSERGNHAEAGELFDQALAAYPDLHEAHMNQAQLRLRHGDFARGWQHYEHRWWGSERGPKRRNFPQPVWRGEALAGRSLLVWGEQGPGDEIIYASMLPDLLEQGAKLVVECEPRLKPLFRRSFPAATVVARSDPAHPAIAADIDFQCPMGSLGQYLRRDFADFPNRPHYLAADALRRDALRTKYKQGGTNLLVGISWRSKSKTFMAGKSSSLAEDWPLVLQTPGVTFVNLQYGDTLADRQAAGVSILHDADIDPLADMDAFAAQVAAMDLVISTSNTTVHVAGALGVPTWVLLPQAQGLLWYWFEARRDNPFYQSVRLYRQPENADWRPVFADVAADLAGLTA